MVALLASPAGADTLEQLLAESGAPGAGIGLCIGTQCEVQVAGLRAVGGAAIEPGDAWHLGSIGKSMTATLAARLSEQGHVSLEGLAPLLRHRAGYAANPALWQRWRLSGARDNPRADRAALVAQNAPKPGDAFVYSNLGYVVAGHMLERATDTPFETLMRQELFAPLGLVSAGFGPPPAIRGHRRTLLGALKPLPATPEADNIAAMAPAGTVHMSLPDLLVYLRAHRDRAALLAPASWARLHAGAPGDYAMGWQVTAEGLAHDGSNTFWYAAVFVWPQWDAVLAITTNAPYTAQVVTAVEEAARTIAAAVKDGATTPLRTP